MSLGRPLNRKIITPTISAREINSGLQNVFLIWITAALTGSDTTK
jgi:hypothetical protein